MLVSQALIAAKLLSFDTAALLVVCPELVTQSLLHGAAKVFLPAIHAQALDLAQLVTGALLELCPALVTQCCAACLW